MIGAPTPYASLLAFRGITPTKQSTIATTICKRRIDETIDRFAAWRQAGETL